MASNAPPPTRPTQSANLTQLPSEILRNIFRSIFEEVIVDVKRPHDLTQQKLIALFPILAVDERLLTEGVDVLLRWATVEIEDLTHFPSGGPGLMMLRKVRNLALQRSHLATFDLSRQFPLAASRSSRDSFDDLQNIDVHICVSLSDLEIILIRGCDKVASLVQSVWQPSIEIEEFDFCYAYQGNQTVEFIQKYQRKYTIVLKMEFWIGGHLRCEAAMCQGLVTEIVVEDKGEWWNEDLWRKTLTDRWKCALA